MEFSETSNVSWESELAYARWYSALPDARKAQMMADFYQFGIEMAAQRALEINPFATKSDEMLLFMRGNQKQSVTPEAWAFIEKSMAERSEREWQTRFRELKKTLGWSYDDMARFVGAASGASVKSSVGRQLPAFAKLAVCVFEELKKRNQGPVLVD